MSRSAPRGGTSVRYQSARRTNQFPPSPAAFPSSSASAVDVPRSQTKNDTRTITEGKPILLNEVHFYVDNFKLIIFTAEAQRLYEFSL